ncbi:MAG: YdcF family protein [Bacilli bacterium]|nr:YdcF family protein [Bacilli bacterium]
MRLGIILGYRLKDDGTMTKRLMKRCELAIQYINEFGLDKLIVSGGVANEHTTVSEAKRMKDYLVARGLDPDFIIEEDRSMTTWDNMEFSMQIAKEQGFDVHTVVVITTVDHYLLSYNTVKICKEYINDPNINMLLYIDTVDNPDE